MINKDKTFILIKYNNKVFTPFLREIILIESLDNYLKIYWGDRYALNLGSIKVFINTYKSYGFIRVNRHYAVNPEYVTEFINEGYDEGALLVGDKKIEFSRRCLYGYMKTLKMASRSSQPNAAGQP